MPSEEKDHMRAALLELARESARAGGRGGKSVRTLHAGGEDFVRLRVGDYRAMCKLLRADRVVLVAAIVHRRDLETWIRRR